MQELSSVLLKRRRASIIFILILLLIGILSITQIPITFYPQTSKPTVALSIRASGYTAGDLYSLYGKQMDEVVKQIEEAEKVTAEYSNNRIKYSIEFPWNFKTQDAKDKVYNISNRIKSIFPTDAVSNFEDPVISSESDDSSGLLAAAIYSSELSNKQLYQEARNILESRFNRDVRDAEEIEIAPVEMLKAEIEFDEASMLSYGLQPDTVINIIKKRYNNQAMGSFRDGRNQYALRYLADTDSLFDIGNIVVATINKKEISLNNIASVNVRYDLPPQVFRANGEAALFIIATPTQGGNIRTMAEDIKEILHNSSGDFTKPVFSEIFVDPAEFIDDAVLNVLNSALQGGLLAILVTLLLLGIPKNSLIVITAIPVSTIYAFILIKLFNVSINLISLSGLALSVGMTVDAAIVVMENIHRHRMQSLQKQDGKTIFTIVVDSVKEVRLSVIAGVLTSICVFLPLAFTAPLANAILGDLALTVVFTLIASLLVSFTAIPILAYYLFKNDHDPVKKVRKAHPLYESFSRRLELISDLVMNKLKNGYLFALNKLLYSKKLMIIFIAASSALFLIAVFGVIRFIPAEIIAKPKSNRIFIFARNNQVDTVEDFISSFEAIEDQVIAITGDELQNRFMQTRNSGMGSLFVTLKSSRNINTIIDRLNEELTGDNWTFFVNQWDPAEMPLPDTYSLKLQITGPDRLKVLGYMEQVQDIITRSRFYSRITTNPPTAPSQEMALKVRHEVLSELEVTDSILVALAKIYLSGSSLTLDEDGTEVSAKFTYPDINNSEAVLNMQVPYKKSSLPLSHFFEAIFTENASRIVIEDQKESYFVMATVGLNDPSGSQELSRKQKQIENLLKDQLHMEEGYNVFFEDAQKETNEAINSLIQALLISVILIFLVLAIQFNSYKLPLVISAAIPLGVIGAIFALKFGGSTLSINSLLGMILLGGTAVNNSIMIVDFYLNTDPKLSKTEAIIEACHLRLAPILSSVLTTLLGMLPIAIGLGDGSNVIQPLGIAVSGGLAFSTFFTLFMIPTILNLIQRPQRDNEI